MRSTKGLSVVFVASTLALAGCGGDDDSPSVPAPPASALTVITEGNSAQVSSTVYRAASVLFDVAAAPDISPAGAVVGGMSSRIGGGGLAGFAAKQLKSVIDRPLPAASGAVGVVYQESQPCAGGGSITARLDDADNNRVDSAGDSLTMTFFSCVEGGQTANGVMSIRLTTVSAATIGSQVAYSNFTLTEGPNVIASNGGFNLTITNNAGVSEVHEIAGDRLVNSLNGDEHTLTGFAGSATTDRARGTVTFTFRGGVADSSNNMTVNVETLSAFVARIVDEYPGSGILRSTGASNSKAQLEAISSTRVRISADPEGDGSFTTPVEWTWSALDALPR